MTKIIEGWKDSLQEKRASILYCFVVLTLMGALAGWALLPDVVKLTGAQTGMTLEKTPLILSHLGLTGIFTALFAWRPREIVYFVAACLGLLLTATPLLNLMV